MQIFWFPFIFFTIMLHWWVVWVPAVVYASFRYGAGACIVVGFLLDGYFGNFYHWPFFTLGALVWYWLVTILRPRIVSVEGVV